MKVTLKSINSNDSEINIFFTSDTHFGHVNITGPNVSSWKTGYRDFETTELMNETLINGINKNVKEDDILFHLGDFAMGGSENIVKFRERINCNNIYLIYGNHDNHIKKNPQYRELFRFCTDVLSLQIDNKFEFFLSHYAHSVWENYHKGVMHLFGHSHGTLEGVGKSMDVGVDVAIKLVDEYRPLSLEEVLRYLVKKPIHQLDHHNEHTT